MSATSPVAIKLADLAVNISRTKSNFGGDDANDVNSQYRAVARLYPNQIFNSSSAGYCAARQTFWNRRQQEAEPRCIFQPTTVEQVCKAIVEVTRCNSPFAIKGGGHSSNVQGSSVHGGFQFDLVNLNHIHISEDRQTVRLGPGLRWSTVFEHLQREKLAVVGGRDASVGVPGFIFGGGLSNHGTLRGWGFDHLVAVDIVLADGKLITVDADNYTDLFTALHGGGAHNFGIVTSLTVKTYPYNGMWGGSIFHNAEHIDEVLDAYDGYTQALTAEGKAHVILHFSRQNGSMICAEWMAYPESMADPPIFDYFRRIPSKENSLRLTEESDLALEVHRLTDSEGKRNSYWTHAFEYDAGLLKSLVAAWTRTIDTTTPRLQFGLEVNHITPAHRLKGAREGQKNVVGLDGSGSMLMNVLLTAVWEEKEDDELVESILQSIGNEFETIARPQGKCVAFKYMNYSNRRQDVIGSFGKDSQTFLKAVASTYDPTGVFQRLQVGGFKLANTWADLQTTRAG